MEIASAMCYMHSRNVLHGDLCGGNVLLCSGMRDERGFICKIADFGLARYMDSETISTSTYGTVCLASSSYTRYAQSIFSVLPL